VVRSPLFSLFPFSEAFSFSLSGVLALPMGRLSEKKPLSS